MVITDSKVFKAITTWGIGWNLAGFGPGVKHGKTCALNALYHIAEGSEVV